VIAKKKPVAAQQCLTPTPPPPPPLKQSFNEIFKAYEAKTGKKLEVTYVPVSELDAKLAANPEDFGSFLHKIWATTGPYPQTDNHLYPDWNPSPVIDHVPVA
jgi:hypothetical protein